MVLYQSVLAATLTIILFILWFLNKKLNKAIKIRQRTEETMNQKSNIKHNELKEDESVGQTTVKNGRTEGIKDRLEKGFNILEAN